MKEISLILPVQLFSNNPLLAKDRTIILLEHPRYFTDFKFHVQKLILHRASMRAYYDKLKSKGYTCKYISFSKVSEYLATLTSNSYIHIMDPVDHKLSKELKILLKRKKITTQWYPSESFLTPLNWIEPFFKNKKRFLLHSFYVAQRKRLHILIHNGKPVGGKWSFDQENRQRLEKDVLIPSLPKLQPSDYTRSAQQYIKKKFPDNPGNATQFIYPISTTQAQRWLRSFLKNRFRKFGPYQDALKEGESFLFHSVLSPALNIGLLTPQYIINTTLRYAKTYKVPIASTEGFVRQIIGWREYVRAVYHLIGRQQTKANFFKNTKRLPRSFYDGTTPLEPVNKIIHKLLKTAYSHHIERLMVLGNSMLLLEINPNYVYNWFMELYIDSYDWVMVPNVYGMSQYADTRMTTKPYITSSQYILKMSNYAPDTWCTIWNGLFWTFMNKHKKKLAKLPRMRFMLNALQKKTNSELKSYKQHAKQFKFIKKDLSL